METVEVVIRLPRSEYEELTRGGYTWWGRHGEYIKKGTVLPKGHGDLKDVDEIERIWKKGNHVRSALLFAPTIIEADEDCEDGR